jgi:FkbM family methyltransferase
MDMESNEMYINVLKRVSFNLILDKNLNLIIRSIFKFFHPIVPKKIIHKVPIVGIVSRQLNNGKTMSMKCNDRSSVSNTFYFQGIYGFEKETIVLFQKLVASCQVVFDIGAHTGFFALFSALENENRQVYAFEPTPKTFKKLKENVLLNKTSNLKPIWGAVSDGDGEVSLYVPRGLYEKEEDVPTSASTLKDFKEDTEEIIVPSITIDSFVKANNIAKVDLMKIDTEGTEHRVLEGAKEVISRDNPLIICEVLPGMTEALLQAFFQNSNYEFFWITDEGLVLKEKLEGDPNFEFLNYLLIPQTKRLTLQKDWGIKIIN